MDKELPWLADNAQLELKYKKGKTPLSHRNWPGEPVPVITENIIQTLGDELLQKAEKKKNIVWRYENFSLEWQSAITQAINLIGEHKPYAGHQLDRRTQTLNHGPDNGGASLYRAK